MIASILLTLLFIFLIYKIRSQGAIVFSYTGIVEKLYQSVSKWNTSESVYLLLAFTCFLLLPLFWGLTFLIKSDWNVIVVLFFFSWSYKWIKIIFLKEED